MVVIASRTEVLPPHDVILDVLIAADLTDKGGFHNANGGGG